MLLNMFKISVLVFSLTIISEGQLYSFEATSDFEVIDGGRTNGDEAQNVIVNGDTLCDGKSLARDVVYSEVDSGTCLCATCIYFSPVRGEVDHGRECIYDSYGGAGFNFGNRGACDGV